MDAILRQGGPFFLVVLLLTAGLLLALIFRRFLFTNPRTAAFRATDVFLLVAYELLPVLFALAAVPAAYLALQRGGLDADWLLAMRLQEVSVLALFLLAA